ncbi:kinase-like protein, partial [Coniochaeta ligniaria NRRL 30616]
SRSNSNGTSVMSPISTGKTSVDSRFTWASGQERDQNGSAEKKQLNSGTVITRPHPGAHIRSSPEGNLAPIEETALDYTSGTILTVERAAAAKIYLETYFNELLSSDPTPRDIRQRKLEIELHRLMHDENFTPEEQEQMRADYYRRETEHLREYRVMKTRSIRALTARKGDLGARVDDEYELLKILGKGSFGVVRLVREKSSDDPHTDDTPEPTQKQVYAMKVIRKSDMLRTSQEGHLRAERDFLVASEGSDWIVPLVASFQDAANLYLVMEYMPGGDFLGLLIRENILHETVARFYIAEMIICIEAAHALKCIHRDVKPDNFLISASGHLKISDFGLAFDGHWSHDMAYYNSHRYSLVHKLGIAVEGDEQDKEEARSVQSTLKWTSTIMSGIEKHNKKDPDDGEPLLNWRNRCGNRTSAMSVVGTSQYMAPEVVAGKPHHDTLGFPARPPVSHRCRHLMEALIRDKEDRLSSKRYKFKDLTSASPSFANIATASSSRPGGAAAAGHSGPKDFSGRYVFPNDAEDIKAHKWFRGIPWDRLHQLEPPFVPRIRSVDDTHYFDEEEEISDWSDSRPTEATDEATPTLPQGFHQNHPLATTTSVLSFPLPPDGPFPTTTTSTALPLPTAPQSLPAPIPPVHAPSLRHQARQAEAALLLRGLSRSIQKWALAAITLPYDSTRVASQLDALPGLEAPDRARLRHFVRLFGRRDRKRPRDRLLRDRNTKGTVMDVRKRTAFLGYTWRRMGSGEKG